jgi:hypothetical protein
MHYPLNLPNELTEFVPETIGYNDGGEIHNLGSLRSWELNEDVVSNRIEIRNAKPSGAATKPIITMVILMTLFCIFFTVLTCYAPSMDDNKQRDLAVRILFIAAVWEIGISTTVLVAAMIIFKISSHASVWKGGIRFRYDKTSGELLFQRENVRYSREDYDELILGVTDGHDSVKMVMNIKDDREYFTEFTQSYFLVHRKDGTWTRHNIGYDQPAKSTYGAIEELQKAMQCLMAKRTMSLQECYATQHKPADSESALEPPPKQQGIYFTFGILLCFMLIGLAMISIGIYWLFLAHDDAVGMTLFGIFWFLMSLGFFLLVRYEAKRNDLSAPYTLSEAVLSLP